MGQTDHDQLITIETGQVLQLLAQGEIKLQGQLLWSSNYAFLVQVSAEELQCLAIYKPQRGERPLWDFANGTLCLREYAAFVFSQALGWPNIPPTVLRQGPYGLGALQFYIDADPDEHFFNIREEHPDEFKQVAAFDILTNNADRKAGHCLRDNSGVVWSIDHGLTFNADPKLRTVIWDYADQPVPQDLLDDLHVLSSQLDEAGELRQTLDRLLSAQELTTLQNRLHALLDSARFPLPGTNRSVPWPLI